MSAASDALKALTPYKRRTRPTDSASFPIYMDQELRRMEAHSIEVLAALKLVAALI